MAEKQTVKVEVFGFSSLLTVAFIVLKLCKVINWSWWWVLAPTWGPVAIYLLIVLGWLFFAILLAIMKNRR